MSPAQTVIFYFSFSVAVAIFGFPRIILRKHPRITSEDISIIRPKLQAIKFLYNIPLLVCPTILLVLLVAAGTPLGKPAYNEFFLFFPVILFLGLYDGVFTLITGIFPATTRWNFNRFVYDQNNTYRWMSILQIGLAVLGMLLCLAMFLFYPG